MRYSGDDKQASCEISKGSCGGYRKESGLLCFFFDSGQSVALYPREIEDMMHLFHALTEPSQPE